MSSGEAIELEERVLADRERLLGADHPDTLSARADLAASYWSAGRTGEAIELEERVLADRKRLLGADHPDTLTARADLATSYVSAGRTGEAIELGERVLADRERLLGAEHPDTMTIREDLAASYLMAGRLDEAFDLQERVLAHRERQLGAEDPGTHALRSALAARRRRLERQSEVGSPSLSNSDATGVDRGAMSDSDVRDMSQDLKTLSPNTTADTLRSMLADAGRDRLRLEPLSVWGVFKRFAVRSLTAQPPERLDPDEDLLEIEWGIPTWRWPWDDDVGIVFWVDFVRQFDILNGDGEYDRTEHLHCTIALKPSPTLRKLGDGGLWSDSDRNAWFTKVTQTDGFRALSLPAEVLDIHVGQWADSRKSEAGV